MLRFFRPVRLRQYILVEFLKCCGLALTVCTLVALLASFIFHAADLEDYGVSIGQIAMLTPYLLPAALAYALPISSLIAAILLFGRLTAENEIQAAQSSGTTIAMLAFPVLVCSLLFSALSLWSNSSGIGWGYAAIREEVLNIANPKVIEKISRPGQSLSLPLQGGESVYINMLPAVEKDGKTLCPLHVAFFKDRHFEESYFAQHYEKKLLAPERQGGNLTLRIQITLYDGQSLGNDPRLSRSFKFFDEVEFVLSIPVLVESQFNWGRTAGRVSLLENLENSRLQQESLVPRREELLDRAADLCAQAVAGSPADPGAPILAGGHAGETRESLNSISLTRRKVRRELVEFHRKFAQSLVPISMVCLGIGLGLLVRKGSRLVGFVLGLIVYVTVYYPLLILCKELSNMRLLPSFTVWLPNAVILLLGLLLWVAYERGYFGAGLPSWTRLGGLAAFRGARMKAWTAYAGKWATKYLAPLMPFRRCADRHVAVSFLTPFLAVVLILGALYFVVDIVDHGGDVVNGILNAHRQLGDAAPRSIPRALWDAFVYYGIRGLGMVFELMPVTILIAGALGATMMVRNNEHLIFKSSGTRLQRAFLPMLVLAAVLALGVSALRQFVMPGLIMERDRLKPLVYHREPKPLCMAGQARDRKGRTILYQFANYNYMTYTGREVSLFEPHAAVDGRIPWTTADRMTWDSKRSCWALSSLAPGPIHRVKEGPEGPQLDHGLIFKPEVSDPGASGGGHTIGVTGLDHWSGSLTPSYLLSRELGPQALRVEELWRLRGQPEYLSEIWKRASEWVIGLFLLMVSLPLLVRQEVRSPVVGVVQCILVALAYLALTLGVSEVARQGLAPSWSPLLPHAAFLCLGVFLFVHKMET